MQEPKNKALHSIYFFPSVKVTPNFKLVIITLVLMLNLPSTLFSQGCWTQVANMPQSRYNAVSFAIGDTGYVLTGQASGGTWRDEFFKYDTNTDVWTQLPDFPGTPRTGAVGFSINGKGYLGTGRDDNGNTDEFWEYDPATALWTQKSDYPPGNREGSTGFSIGNKGYIGMGLNGSGKTDFYEYDPTTDSWTPKANFPIAIGRHSAVGFSIGSKGYIGTGYHSGFNRNNDFWEYDPATDLWTQLANVPGPLRGAATGFSASGVGYVGIGDQYSDFYSYDVSSDTWSQITDYGPGKRYKAACFVVNDIPYVGSGYYSGTKWDWWKFDPASIEYLAPITGCDSVLFDSNYFTASDTVVTIVPGVTANACDSIYKQPIIVYNPYSVSLPDITMCDSAQFEGVYYYQDITLTQNLSSAITGCDSVVTINLIVKNSSSGTAVVSTCDSYTWIDGNTYTASNNSATHTLSNAQGCDSVVTLDLTILNSSVSTDVVNACDSFTWIDGNTYTASNNSATHTLNNAQGCDSIVTLDLTILNSNASTDVVNACDSFTWIDGNTYTASNNTATHTLNNAQGCDSIVTLDLTILNSSVSTDVVNACDSFTWIDGNTYTTSNNSATHTLSNAQNCDSVVTLDLTINTVNASVTQLGVLLTANETGANYQWLTCPSMVPISGATNQSYSPSSIGEYAVVVSNANCSDTSSCFVVNDNSILENGFGKKLLVYPNPTYGDLSIDLGAVYSTTNVQLTDISGHIIQSEIFLNKELLQVHFEASSGTYFLTIETEGKRSVILLIKE